MTRANARELAVHLIYGRAFTGEEPEQVVTTRLEKEYYEKLKDEIQGLLERYHDDGKDPNPVAKGMSWMKTNLKLTMEGSDATIAELMTNGCNMGAGNFVLDLAEVPYIDLDPAWWDQGIRRDVTINERTYIATGDISIVDNDATWVLMFNKQMAQNQDYDLYQLVRDNKWYYETMYDMVKNCAKDLNGDGKMEYTDDRFGIGFNNKHLRCLFFSGRAGAVNLIKFIKLKIAERTCAETCEMALMNRAWVVYRCM